MKSTNILAVALCVCIFGLSNARAQIQITADLFTTVWKVDFDEHRYIKNMQDDEWNAFKTLTTMQRHTLLTSMKKEASQTTFQFKANREFIVKKSGEVLEAGMWELQPDGKTLIAKNDKGFEDIIEIVEMHSKRMILNSREYGQELILVPLRTEGGTQVKE